MNFGIWSWHTVDKPAKNSNGVKVLLVHQDVFDRTVVPRRVETKVSKQTVDA